MAENDSNGVAKNQQQQGIDGDKKDDGQTGDGEPKIYTDDQVQGIVQKRVKGLSKKNIELEAKNAELDDRLKALEKKGTPVIVKKDDSTELTTLKSEIAALKNENASTKAERDKATLEAKKIKACKGRGLPGWFDPATMLPGTTDEEIDDAIDNILKEKDAAEKEETERRKKQSFGGPTPKSKGGKMTADDYMNNQLLSKLGKSRIR